MMSGPVTVYLHGIICYYGLGTSSSDVWSCFSLYLNGIICYCGLGTSNSDV